MYIPLWGMLSSTEVHIKLVPLGNALSLFLVITFSLCMVWGLIAPPTLHMHQAWEPLLPGFSWSLPGFLIGLVWAYFYGWYAAALFVPLYNFFNRKAAT